MRIRLTENRLRNIIRECINESFRTYNNCRYNLYDKLYELDIDFDYANEEETVLEIDVDDESMRKKINHLLNVYGWKNIKDDGFHIYAERVYGDKMNDFEDPEQDNFGGEYGVYYHVTPSNKVAKILRQGLTPREGNRLGYSRGERVYLISYPSTHMINNFHNRGDNRNYVILQVDLRGLIGNKINLYQDELAEEGAVYTYEPIPPQCISIYKRVENEKKY